MSTREQVAQMLLRDVQGLDLSDQESQTMQNLDSTFNNDVFGADDPVARAGLSTLNVELTVANGQQLGNAATGLTLFSAGDASAAALPTGLVTPVIATYREWINYFIANPAQIVSINAMSNESSTTGAPLLSSMTFSPARVTPFGLQMSNQVNGRTYQTTQDFQANRLTVPVSMVIDGFTRLVMTSAVNASGAAITVNLAILFKKIAQARAPIMGGAQVVKPGGRGIANVK